MIPPEKHAKLDCKHFETAVVLQFFFYLHVE